MHFMGQTTYKTTLGAIVSVFMIGLMFTVAYASFHRLITKNNPEVTQFNEYGVAGNNDSFDIFGQGFDMAFVLVKGSSNVEPLDLPDKSIGKFTFQHVKITRRGNETIKSE